MWVIEAMILAGGIGFGLAVAGTAIERGLSQIAAALTGVRPGGLPRE